MKKLTLLTLLFIPVMNNCQSQNFYISLAGTYQFKLGGFPASESSSINGVTTNKSRLVNIASGPGGGIIFGFNLNDKASLEGRFIYQTGKQTFEDKYTSTGFSYTNTATLKGKLIRFEPLFKLKTGDDKIKYYLGIGPSINLFTKMSEEDYSTDLADTEEMMYEYTGNIAYGGTGLIGLEYSFSEKLSFFGECNVTAQTWAPKKGSKIKHLVNGVDNLPYQSVYQKETEFVNEYTYSGSPDTSKPNQETKIHFPLSTWGFFAGIKFTF